MHLLLHESSRHFQDKRALSVSSRKGFSRACQHMEGRICVLLTFSHPLAEEEDTRRYIRPKLALPPRRRGEGSRRRMALFHRDTSWLENFSRCWVLVFSIFNILASKYRSIWQHFFQSERRHRRERKEGNFYFSFSLIHLLTRHVPHQLFLSGTTDCGTRRERSSCPFLYINSAAPLHNKNRAAGSNNF